MNRGDVYELRTQRAVRGHEQRGRRHAVIVQAVDLVRLSTVVMVPTSTRALEAWFRPRVTIGGKPTRALVDQLRALDPSRLGSLQDRLDRPELAELDHALELFLGLRYV